MTRRPAVIFDFGNVVAHFDYLLVCERLGRTIGMSADAFLTHATNAGFIAALKEYESGGLTSEAFHRRVSEITGVSVSFDEFRPAWADMFRENESLRPVIVDLKRQGYTLILGSNTNEIHAEHYKRQFVETFKYFDRLILSHEVGAIKPASIFYEACAAAAGLPPGECVFIDDLAENVEGARGVGLIGVHYIDTPRLIEDLKNFGILIDR